MESNKTEVLSFDEWLNEQAQPASNFLRRETYEAGQQSKQGEVDKLQTEIDHLQKRVRELELINFDSELHFDAAKEHIDHLQKKIDGINKLMSEQVYHTPTLIREVKEILKGEQS